MTTIKVFHNTIDASGATLENHIATTVVQNDRILEIFKKSKGKPLTPREVWRIDKKATELTSVRRAINNLTMIGLLKKSEFKKVETAGAQNFCWILQGATIQKTIFDKY